ATRTPGGRRPVLLGHTLDDQACCSGWAAVRGRARCSIAGMRPYVAPWGRPLLGVRRRLTAAACTELGLTPWHDPHNSDHRFTRVRLRREVLPLLEEVLGGGVAEALARTAAAVGEDTDYLDGLAEARLRDTADPRALDSAGLGALPAPIRRRVLR
ncbi:ATP-binding protein, partial [Mycolicibacillus trivialis]|uniref:ATP-binding protein n=1 Tax=Mycolicibacillus trivialis TaxID=1798 RepID=UPI0023DF7FF8